MDDSNRLKVWRSVQSVRSPVVKTSLRPWSRQADECLDESGTSYGAGPTNNHSKQPFSVTHRLKNEMKQQQQEQLADELAQLTSLCKTYDEDNAGTLDKTLVSLHCIHPAGSIQCKRCVHRVAQNIMSRQWVKLNNKLLRIINCTEKIGGQINVTDFMWTIGRCLWHCYITLLFWYLYTSLFTIDITWCFL